MEMNAIEMRDECYRDGDECYRDGDECYRDEMMEMNAIER